MLFKMLFNDPTVQFGSVLDANLGARENRYALPLSLSEVSPELP